ncbi:MAG: hypothetical protein MHM6MM_000229 [Cercozoa sp. M6MM]
MSVLVEENSVSSESWDQVSDCNLSEKMPSFKGVELQLAEEEGLDKLAASTDEPTTISPTIASSTPMVSSSNSKLTQTPMACTLKKRTVSVQSRPEEPAAIAEFKASALTARVCARVSLARRHRGNVADLFVHVHSTDLSVYEIFIAAAALLCTMFRLRFSSHDFHHK